MSRQISRLSVRSFRGATQPATIEFEKGKPLVIIFGENGCGKSSLVDAIDFVANRSFGSLNHRSVDGHKHPFLAAFGQESEDIEITLHTRDGGTWNATLDGRAAAVERTSDEGELPIVRVLRRAEILDIVEATPSERYKALGPFIDVISYQKSEESLREAVRRSESSYNQAVARQEQAIKSLEGLWETEGSPQENAFAWAKLKSREAIDDLQDRETTLKNLQKAAESLETSTIAYGKAGAAVFEADRLLDDVREELKDLPKLEGVDAVQLVSMLREASPLVSAEPESEKCPLCLQPKPGKELRASIEERLEKLDDFVQLGERLEKAERRRDVRQDARETSWGKLAAGVHEYADMAEAAEKELPSEAKTLHQELKALLDENTPEAERKAVRTSRRLALACAPLDEKLGSITADLAKHNGIRVQYENLISAKKDAQHQETLCERLKEAHQIVEKTRKDYVNGVLNSIGGACKSYYDQIHPDEPLGSPRLAMHENRPKSVELAGFFGTQDDIPPQGYYSESHLDTLGFCVWLAIAGRSEPKDTVLVIDDVFTSVDSQHISRIVGLISDIAEEFAQVIVATHYRNWRDRYRLSHAPGLNAQLLELSNWSLERGISSSSTVLAVEELDARIATEPLERQAVASQAGILLEALFDYLTLLYQRKLPRNHKNEWTLGDLLSACQKLFGVLTIERDEEPELLPEEEDAIGDGETEPVKKPASVEEAIAPFYIEMGQLSFLRNQVGCHFNASGGEISNDDVVAFGKATSALVKAITCQGCGQIPSRRMGDHFACTCGKTKMRPLEFKKG